MRNLMQLEKESFQEYVVGTERTTSVRWLVVRKKCFVLTVSRLNVCN